MCYARKCTPRCYSGEIRTKLRQPSLWAVLELIHRAQYIMLFAWNFETCVLYASVGCDKKKWPTPNQNTRLKSSDCNTVIQFWHLTVAGQQCLTLFAIRLGMHYQVMSAACRWHVAQGNKRHHDICCHISGWHPRRAGWQDTRASYIFLGG